MSLIRSALHFYVNGSEVVLDRVDPSWTLIFYLREKRRLTGTKVACDEGGCGACTVMVSSYDAKLKQVHHCAMNACLILLCSLDGKAITTIEGVGSTKTLLHPLQEQLAKSHGTQCGFCSPGMIMSMYALLRSNSKPSLQQIESAISGNLCRCTGYRPILQAFQKFAEGGECAMGDQCCKKQVSDKSANAVNNGVPQSDADRMETTQELIFPPKLKIQKNEGTVRFTSDHMTWWSPSSLDELLQLKHDHPDALIGAGYTIVSMMQKRVDGKKSDIISVSRVPELQSASLKSDSIYLGAGLTMSQIVSYSEQWLSVEKTRKLHYLESLKDVLQWFGSTQIRNAATIGGHIAAALATSDILSLMYVTGAKVLLKGQAAGERLVSMNQKLDVPVNNKNELVVGVLIPFASQENFCLAIKQSARKELSTSIVTVAVNVCFSREESLKVESATASCGVVVNTEATDLSSLIGKSLSTANISSLIGSLQSPADTQNTYRHGLYTLLVEKCLTVVQSARQSELSLFDYVSEKRLPVRGNQQWVEEHNALNEDCGKPIHHAAAMEHTTGEAIYVDDLPRIEGELFLAPVLSPVANGKLLGIDCTAALSMPGVVDCISAKDIKGINLIPGLGRVCFAHDKLDSQGEFVAAVLAETRDQARAAAATVKIDVEEYKPTLTIEDAIDAKNLIDSGLFQAPLKHVKGDVKAGFAAADEIFTGEVSTGGQKHFYLETQSCLVTSKERGEIEVIISTQEQTSVQMAVAVVTGVPFNRVLVKTKRAGGAFGGKADTGTNLAMMAAVAANKLSRPIRSVLDRKTDTRLVGGRESGYAKYKVGVKRNGQITAIELDFYCNSGSDACCSAFNILLVMISFENGYFIPNIQVDMSLCKTNISHKQHMRATGMPIGAFLMEYILDHVARHLSLDATQVRRKHLIQENAETIWGQKVKDCTAQACWDQVMKDSNYTARKKVIDKFNREHTQKKRGIAISATKYGFPIIIDFLNHGEALVHIYTDGSVYVAHGGVEIGQGLHTKITQIASRALGVPYEKIYIQETNTSTTANCFPTMGSCGTDLQGPAVQQACEELKATIDKFRTAMPDASWEQLVQAAHFSRAPLTASACCKPDFPSMDLKTMATMKSENAYQYFSFGAGVCEVELDCSTGEVQILRTDIVMDVGKSLNPAIDIGQIEGAFMQGFGYFCLEEPLYDTKGTLLTDNVGTYKVPGRRDVPLEFNVSLLPNVKGKAVYSSKAIGEPPLLLSTSAFFALKEAVGAKREDDGIKGYFRTNTPMTAEERLRATRLSYLQKVKEPVTKLCL